MDKNRNMKLKYYLRGLGTGIVITTLVLTISFNVRSCTSNRNLQNETTTENDKGISSDEKNNTEDTSKHEKTTKESETTEEKTTKEKTTKESETTEKSTTEKSTTEKQTENKTTEETSREMPVTKETVTFTVTNGMSSESVAAMLENIGAVDSAYEFNRYLYQMDYERIIRVGTYEVEAGASYEEIAQIIIRGN